MLVAGIPVVANELAARSYYNTDGVNVVANVDFCQESLNRLDLENQIPPVPDKPDALTLEENLLQLMQQQ